jgi:putative FmdB family regulatory protein
MPIYTYECPRGHIFERILKVADYMDPQMCEMCCGWGKKVITVPTVFTSKDVCYDSPIDGRPITSMRARLDDLARNNCTPYDPEMKTDYSRRVEREQLRLEKSVEATVEAAIEAMPPRKREKLEAELKSGADCTPERQSAPFTTTKKVKYGH